MNSVAPSFRADINHRVADALGLGQKNVFLARNPERQGVYQRILRVARLEADFSADCRHAKTVSVVRHAANYTVQDSAVGCQRRFVGWWVAKLGRNMLRPYGRDGAESQRIQHGNWPRAHGEDVA